MSKQQVHNTTLDSALKNHQKKSKKRKLSFLCKNALLARTIFVDRRGRQSRGKGSLIRKFFSPSSQSRRQQPVPLPFLHNKRREEEYKKFIEEKHHQQSEFHTFPNSWHFQVKYVIYVFEHLPVQTQTSSNYQMRSTCHEIYIEISLDLALAHSR